MPAVIRIDQERPSGLSSGTAGVARNDLWLGRTVHLRAADPHPDATYSWSILTAPPGSSAELAGAATEDCTFIPDVANHTFRMKLTQVVAGVRSSSIKCLGTVRDEAGNVTGRGWVFPAFDERPPENNYAGNLRGTAPAVELILADLRDAGGGGGGTGPAGPAGPTGPQGPAGAAVGAVLTDVAAISSFDCYTVSRPAGYLVFARAEHRLFIYDPSSPAATVAGSIIQPTGPGRFFLVGDGGGSAGLPKRVELLMQAGPASSSVATESNKLLLGCVFFDDTQLAPGATVSFEVIIESSTAENLPFVDLCLVSDGSQVAGSQVGLSGATVPTGTSADVTAVIYPSTYQARLWMDPHDPAQIVTCLRAAIVITNP